MSSRYFTNSRYYANNYDGNYRPNRNRDYSNYNEDMYEYENINNYDKYNHYNENSQHTTYTYRDALAFPRPKREGGTWKANWRNHNRDRTDNRPSRGQQQHADTHRARYNNSNRVRRDTGDRRQGTQQQLGDFKGSRQQRGPRQSQNPDFLKMVVNIYKYVVNNHHIHNWGNLPPSICNKLSEIFDSVSPPLKDDKLNNNLYTLFEETKTKLTHVVLEHLSDKQEMITYDTSKLDQKDRTWAMKVAYKRINRNNKKINLNSADQILDPFWKEVDGFISKRQPINNDKVLKALNNKQQTTSTNNQLNNNGNIQTNKTRPTQDTVEKMDTENANTCFTPISKGAKRKQQDRYENTIQTQNRYEILSEDNTENVHTEYNNNTKKQNNQTTPDTNKQTHEQDEQLFSTPEIAVTQINKESIQSGSKAKKCIIIGEDITFNEQHTSSSTHTPYTQPTTQNSLKYRYRATIHEKQYAANWAINPDTEADTILIGDSNLRHASTPENMEAHAFIGANLTHASHILTQLGEHYNNSKPKKNIIITIGMNNRADNTEEIRYKLDKLINTMNITPKNLNVSFLGLGIPLPENSPKLSEENIQNLTYMNNYAKNKLGKKYIPELQPEQVYILPGDPWGIHYNSKTIQYTMNNICDFLELRGSQHNPQEVL